VNIRYRVDLSQSERDELSALVSGGKLPVRRLKRMQILLAADAGIGDEAIAASVANQRLDHLPHQEALCGDRRLPA